MDAILAIRFGNVYQRRAAGYALVSRVYSNPGYLWATPVNESASLIVIHRGGHSLPWAAQGDRRDALALL